MVVLPAVVAESWRPRSPRGCAWTCRPRTGSVSPGSGPTCTHDVMSVHPHSTPCSAALSLFRSTRHRFCPGFSALTRGLVRIVIQNGPPTYERAPCSNIQGQAGFDPRAHPAARRDTASRRGDRWPSGAPRRRAGRSSRIALAAARLSHRPSGIWSGRQASDSSSTRQLGRSPRRTASGGCCGGRPWRTSPSASPRARRAGPRAPGTPAGRAALAGEPDQAEPVQVVEVRRHLVEVAAAGAGADHVQPGAIRWLLTMPTGPPVRTSTLGCGPLLSRSSRIRASSGARSSRIRSKAGCPSSVFQTSRECSSSSSPRSRSVVGDLAAADRPCRRRPRRLRPGRRASRRRSAAPCRPAPRPRPRGPAH